MNTNTLERKPIETECISWRWNGNLGDDMIFAAQEALFKDALRLDQYIAEPQAVLVGGGTFVPKAPHHPDLVNLSRRFPTAFFGTGIGDPEFWGKEHINSWIEIINNSRFIGVRGPLSKERLQSWGISGERIEWIGDSALYFADNSNIVSKFKGRLAVNIGTSYGKLYGFNDGQLELYVTEVLKKLAGSGWRITFVCAWEPDEEVMNRVQAAVPGSDVEHWHDDYLKALQSMKQFDIVLTHKLHVGVIAACQNIPFVALNYRSKVMDFCRSIGWERFCVNTDKLDPGQILQHLRLLSGEIENYSEQLRQEVHCVREKLLGAVPKALAALRPEL